MMMRMMMMNACGNSIGMNASTCSATLTRTAPHGTATQRMCRINAVMVGHFMLFFIALLLPVTAKL